MRKLGIVALTLAAVAIVLSAWTIHAQDASTRRDQPIVTVIYDSGTAYLWEWQGSELVALTTFFPHSIDGTVVKKRWPVTEQKK